MRNTKPPKGRGGARPGSGRKPKAATVLKLRLAEHGAAEAETSFSLLCHWRDDETKPMPIRLECAKTILDRVLGKASQPIQMSWKEEARMRGVDPDALVNQFVAAMGAGSGGPGGVGADADRAKRTNLGANGAA